MLTTEERTAILELRAKGVSRRKIAILLGLSRRSVRKVLASRSRERPPSERPEKAAPHEDRILELHRSCEGNLVRIHEELEKEGVTLSYPALTGFCRRHGIGTPPLPRAAGSYTFEPGEEMQHDTSPHRIVLGGQPRLVQTAAGVLCYSRMLFFQCYPTFQRFDCKVFLTEALRFFEGAPKRVMIDNTSVVVLRGTGREMVPVPEMKAFSDRYDFHFVAHELRDANRSARVERPFWYIERSFFPGRTFADWADLNRQAREWCDRVNGKFKRNLRAIPRDLYRLERTRLNPLPAYSPEPYRIHIRIVDSEGFVNLNTNRYSVPEVWIGRQAEVRETASRIEISIGPHLALELSRRDPAAPSGSVIHERIVDAVGRRVTLPEHRRPRGRGAVPRPPSPDRQALEREAPELVLWLDELEKRARRGPALARRQLLRLVRDYPRGALASAIEEASRYNLWDLDRIERMTLRRIGRETFRLNPIPDPSPEGDDHD